MNVRVGRYSVHEETEYEAALSNSEGSRTVQRAGMLIYGALGSCIVTGLPGASEAGAHSVSSTQLVPIVVRIDTKCDDDVEQPVEIGVGRSSETGWICRGYGKPGKETML